MFGNPTPAHFVSASLELPILVIILNNKMWAAVRRATLSLYPDGAASKSNQAPLTLLEPAPDYEKIVEASGGLGIRVETLAELPDALKRGLEAVDGGRSAVLNVMVRYSDQAALADSKR
jgi:acetolactate synthase-1/2/3 large subunit